MISDAQVHIWSTDTPERPWTNPRHSAFLEHRPYPSFDITNLSLKMYEANVHRAIIIPPSWEGNRNDLALSASQRYPERYRVMGRINFHLAKPDILRGWLNTPGMLGLRVTMSTPATDLPAGPDQAPWLWREAEEEAIPIMIFAPDHLDDLEMLADRHQTLRIIVDHLALPATARDKDLLRRVDELTSLALHPNVAIKLSALPCYTSDHYPFTRLIDPVRQLINLFGPERCMWASDVTRLPCSYREWLLFITDATFLTEEEKEWILGRSMVHWLNWPEECGPQHGA